MNSEVDVSSSILLGSQDIISIIVGGGMGRRRRVSGLNQVGYYVWLAGCWGWAVVVDKLRNSCYNIEI